MESKLFPHPQPVAAEADRGAILSPAPVADRWNGLSRDVIERFIDVAGFVRKASPAERSGYRVDLYALEAWMERTTGHTVMMASTAELWTYVRKALASDIEPRLLDRLLASIQHFYAYAREGGFREDDPVLSMPLWACRHFIPATMSSPMQVRANA
jgi:site-specific recombinase XerD